MWSDFNKESKFDKLVVESIKGILFLLILFFI
jgi:hypothetical protein